MDSIYTSYIAYHTHSDQTTQEWTLFQQHVTFKQMYQEKSLTLLRGCPQLAPRNSHDKRCKGYQEKESTSWSKHRLNNRISLVDVISILNVTRYDMQVNRQHINIVMEVCWENTQWCSSTLFNIISSIYTCLNYQQILLHIQLHSGWSQGIFVLHETDGHACDGLRRYSHYHYIIITCISSRRFTRDSDIHPKQNYHQPCTYLYHQMTSFTSIDTCTPTF